MEQSDIELMLCAQKGDMAAFQQLVQRYREPLRRFFASLLLDSTLAEDCAQETFLRLWLMRREYAPMGKFSAYLFQIGRHQLLNQKRKLRHEASRMPMEAAQDVPTPEQTQPEWIVLRQEREARLQQAILQLPAHLRAVMELRHARQGTHAEIARQLQIPVGTVKSRLSEAARRLRKALPEDG